MKQKNLILMVVAVGCGLLAAFLTSQMSAKPAAAPTQTKVLRVAKELAPGTKFTLDSIKDQFKECTINPEAIPEKAITTEDLLDGKVLNKTVRVDDFIREGDLGNYHSLDVPEGKNVVTVKLPIHLMTPFVQPSARVDIMGTVLTKDQKVKSAVLIPNVLIMAVDTRIQPPNGTPGDLASQMVTVAANEEEARAIRSCEQANVKLSFILHSDTNKPNAAEFSYDKVASWVNDDQAATIPNEAPKTAPMSDPLTKVYVPTVDLPAGTELTSDVLTNKFKEIQMQGALPPNAVEKVKDHIGRFIVKDIYAEQFVPKNCLADSMPKKPDVAKAIPDENPTPKTVPAPEKEKEKLATFDRSIVGPSGTKVYRYEVSKSGELRILGEVTADGSVVPTTNLPLQLPKEEPKKNDKDEKGEKEPKKVS